jgi:hypothetical protein
MGDDWNATGWRLSGTRVDGPIFCAGILNVGPLPRKSSNLRSSERTNRAFSIQDPGVQWDLNSGMRKAFHTWRAPRRRRDCRLIRVEHAPKNR